jgi:hypothetical protein
MSLACSVLTACSAPRGLKWSPASWSAAAATAELNLAASFWGVVSQGQTEASGSDGKYIETVLPFDLYMAEDVCNVRMTSFIRFLLSS